MSHRTQIRLEIRDLQALIDALHTLYGAVEVFPTPTRRRVAWSREEAVVAYVPATACGGAYDSGIGVVEDQGGYALVLDNETGGGAARVRAAIMRAYALVVAERTLRAQGYILVTQSADGGATQRVYAPMGGQAPQVTLSVNADGTVTVGVTGMAGMGCLSLTNPIVQALGTVVSGVLTPDAYTSAEDPAWVWGEEREQQ